MRRTLRYISILMLFGCAQQVAPTGGPKDETPPRILKEVPANLSTDFNSKQIVISFDEFIQLKSTSEQVVISPPMLRSPSYQLKQKSLVVKFEQALAPNTTYTINFGEAIADNNEGNILKNYTYVFSTGAHLDSMQVKGRLIDAITGEAEKDALVMLYKNDIDSLPLDTIPDYFTRTLEDGSFHIKNVADQPYKVFALKDENANYRFDVPTEKIGFVDSLILPFTPPVSVTPDTLTADSLKTDSVMIDSLRTKKGSASLPYYELQMFVEEDTTQYLKKAYCDYFGKLVFVYNRPVATFELSLEDVEFKKQWKLKDFNSTRDTITVWTTVEVPDTMRCLVSVDGAKIDTVELNMKPRTEEITLQSKSSGRGKGGKKSASQKFELTAATQPATGRSPKPNAPLYLLWNHPVIVADLSRVKLYEDSVRVLYDIEARDPALRKFGLSYKWKKDKNYRLLVLDSAFSDIYNLYNDTIETSFKGSDKEMFGELSLKITEKPNTNLLVELLNSANVSIETRTVSNAETIMFEKLDPGKYNLQVVVDRNQNGKWDSGRYSEKIQPEPIRVVQQGAEVRANWNFELEWNPNEGK